MYVLMEIYFGGGSHCRIPRYVTMAKLQVAKKELWPS